MQPALPLLALALTAVPAAASASGVGLTQAVAAAERALDARAIDAEYETSGTAGFYEIDLVRDRTLHQARVDARTGKLISRAQPRIEGAWMRWFASEKLDRAAGERPLAELLRKLEAQTSGKVREVEFETEHGSAWYEVKVQTAAGITEVRLDSHSGQRLAAVYDD